MVRSLLIRGMLVGLGAGLLAFLFAHTFGEPQVQPPIDFEDHLAAIHHEAPGPEVVSRGVQRTWGLLTGTVATGVALGGLFGLVYAYAYGRGGALGAGGAPAAPGAGGRVRRSLLPSIGGWNAVIVAGVVLIVVVAVAELILPAVHETPAG